MRNENAATIGVETGFVNMEREAEAFDAEMNRRSVRLYRTVRPSPEIDLVLLEGVSLRVRKSGQVVLDRYGARAGTATETWFRRAVRSVPDDEYTGVRGDLATLMDPESGDRAGRLEELVLRYLDEG